MTKSDVFPWLPLGHEVATGISVGRVISHGPEHQLIRSRDGRHVLLLAIANSNVGRSVAELCHSSGLRHFQPLIFGSQNLLAGVFRVEEEPLPVSELARRPAKLTSAEAAMLAAALVELAERTPTAAWASSLFLQSLGKCVPVEAAAQEDRRTLAVRLLTGGIADPTLSPQQIHGLNQWLTLQEIESFLTRLGVGLGPRPPMKPQMPEGGFDLPGRPKLASLFREYVIDYYRDRERYQSMRVKPPGGFLLYGPPGTGKTHAAKQLAIYLGWPVFEINIGSVGSPYIHQTSLQLRRTFEQAAAKAPSLLIFNEFDALSGSRASLSQDYKLEEVSELLQLIETAAERQIVFIATSNRRDAIDDAMLRRGRFDHIIEVGYPTLSEVRAALAAMLAERPQAAGLNLDRAAEKLQERPMSDIAWIINEAARIAVKIGKDEIDDICLFRALGQLT